MHKVHRRGNVLAYLLLSLGALIILFPLYICITTTFKTPSESAISFFTLPSSFYLGNYATVLADEKLYYAYQNTLMITICALLLEFIIMPPMSYALSRSMGRSKPFRFLYFFFLMGIFLPFQVRMMPLVKLMGWFDLLKPSGMVLLYLAHATCESTFLYVGYLATVSPSLE
ncbi:MAG: carbohydrate ABC transporter permease, partial [Clostridia bacterium]